MSQYGAEHPAVHFGAFEELYVDVHAKEFQECVADTEPPNQGLREVVIVCVAVGGDQLECQELDM